MKPRCAVCGGPVTEVRGGLGVLWLHDNSTGWYAGRQTDHDASREDQPPERSRDMMLRMLEVWHAGLNLNLTQPPKRHSAAAVAQWCKKRLGL